MPFVTFADRYEREQGEIAGLLIGLRAVRRIRFAAEGEGLMPAAEKIEDPDKLADLLAAVERAASLDDVRRALLPAGDAPTAPATE